MSLVDSPIDSPVDSPDSFHPVQLPSVSLAGCLCYCCLYLSQGVRIRVVVDDSPPRPGERRYPEDDGYWTEINSTNTVDERGEDATQERRLRQRCGDLRCPTAACGMGLHIPIYVFIQVSYNSIQENSRWLIFPQADSTAFEWQGPISSGQIHWIGMDHFLHMLEFAVMGEWTVYEIYTVVGPEDGWSAWDSGIDYDVPSNVSLLVMRVRGLGDCDCPGISALISRYHVNSESPKRYRA